MKEKKDTTSVILRCSCNHSYQDKVYGKGKRVFNRGDKGLKCTVCGHLIQR